MGLRKAVSRFFAIAFTCIVCALLGAACNGSSSAEADSVDPGPPQHGGTIVFAMAKEPAIINPWLAQGAQFITWMLIDGVNDPFITLDENGEWQPVLAEKVPTQMDGSVSDVAGNTVVELDIRKEAHWSDGVPITCDDLVFTWQTVVNPKYQLSNRLGWQNISDIDCDGTKRAVIKFDGRYGLVLSRILAYGPLPAHELKGKDFNTYWNEKFTVSSGAFLFDRWDRGVQVVLKRNPDYWNAGKNDLPYADRVIFRFVKDANTLKMQLRMTESDIAMLPADTNLVEELKATPGISYQVVPGAVVELLTMQTKNPPLDDVHVRRAIAHAVDRDMIAKVVLKGVVEPIQSPMVPTQEIWRFNEYAKYRPNYEKVEAELKSAGWTRKDSKSYWTKGGKELELRWVAAAGSMPFRVRTAQLVQEQLRQVGIKTEISMIMPEVLYGDVAPRGHYHLGEWSEQTGVEPEPGLLFTCSQIPKHPQWAGKNRYRYCNPDLDRLIALAEQEPSLKKRAQLIRQIDAIVADDLPVIPLFQAPDTVAWINKVHGVVPNGQSGHTWNMENWWVSQ